MNGRRTLAMPISFNAPLALCLSIYRTLVNNIYKMVDQTLTCIAALNTSKREDSISARDLAISATTVPKYNLYQSRIIF